MLQRSTRAKSNLYHSYMQEANWPSVLQDHLCGRQSPLSHDIWRWLKSLKPIYIT